MFRIFICLLLAATTVAIIGCANKGVTPPEPIPKTHAFSHSYGNLKSKANVGIWMFTDKFWSVANWGTQNSLNLLEPINVVWVDYTAKSVTEAITNVENYLSENGFIYENGFVVLNGVETPWHKHSSGYFAYYNIDFYSQQPNDDGAWVTAEWPNANNHGRIFPPYNAGDNGDTVFYTLGAFSTEGTASIEKVIMPLTSPLHPFISFDMAKEVVTATLSKYWKYDGIDANWGNILSDNDPSGYNTGDHTGVGVLYRFNEPPDAFFSVSPMSGPTNTIFTFNIEGTIDHEDELDELSFRWDWDNDGNWTDFASFSAPTYSITHQFSTTGMKCVNMEVRDSDGKTATYLVSGIYVNESNYKLEIVSGNNQTFSGGLIPYPMTIRILNLSTGKYLEHDFKSSNDLMIFDNFDVSLSGNYGNHSGGWCCLCYFPDRETGPDPTTVETYWYINQCVTPRPVKLELPLSITEKSTGKHIEGSPFIFTHDVPYEYVGDYCD